MNGSHTTVQAQDTEGAGNDLPWYAQPLPPHRTLPVDEAEEILGRIAQDLQHFQQSIVTWEGRGVLEFTREVGEIQLPSEPIGMSSSTGPPPSVLTPQKLQGRFELSVAYDIHFVLHRDPASFWSEAKPARPASARNLDSNENFDLGNRLQELVLFHNGKLYIQRPELLVTDLSGFERPTSTDPPGRLVTAYPPTQQDVPRLGEPQFNPEVFFTVGGRRLDWLLNRFHETFHRREREVILKAAESGDRIWLEATFQLEEYTAPDVFRVVNMPHRVEIETQPVFRVLSIVDWMEQQPVRAVRWKYENVESPWLPSEMEALSWRKTGESQGWNHFRFTESRLNEPDRWQRLDLSIFNLQEGDRILDNTTKPVALSLVQNGVPVLVGHRGESTALKTPPARSWWLFYLLNGLALLGIGLYAGLFSQNSPHASPAVIISARSKSAQVK